MVKLRFPLSTIKFNIYTVYPKILFAYVSMHYINLNYTCNL